jgi:hypothetical protein
VPPDLTVHSSSGSDSPSRRTELLYDLLGELMSMPGLDSTANRLFIGGFAAALFVEFEAGAEAQRG